jgi:hypothetical protein
MNFASNDPSIKLRIGQHEVVYRRDTWGWVKNAIGAVPGEETYAGGTPEAKAFSALAKMNFKDKEAFQVFQEQTDKGAYETAKRTMDFWKESRERASGKS